MKYKLLDLLTEYKETNKDSLYEPVAVGKYGIRKRNEIYKKELSDDYSKNKVIRNNTLIVGMGSSQIDIGVLSEDEIYSVSPAYHTYRINVQVVSSDYLDLLFKANNANYFKKYSIATARQGKKIDLKSLLNEMVDIPSFEKQDIIVGKIFDINELIRIEEKSLSLLEEMTKSRFVEMFGECDLNKRQINWFKLGDVTEIVTGTTPSTHIEDNWSGKHLWITPAEIKDDSFYIYDTERKLSDIGLSSKSLRVMPINTVLLSTRAPIGKTAIVGKPMACNQGFKNFICKDKLNPIFLYILLKFNKDYLNSIGSGTTFKEISKTVVSNIEIPVPPIILQNQFSSFVEQVDKLKFNFLLYHHLMVIIQKYLSFFYSDLSFFYKTAN